VFLASGKFDELGKFRSQPIAVGFASLRVYCQNFSAMSLEGYVL